MISKAIVLDKAKDFALEHAKDYTVKKLLKKRDNEVIGLGSSEFFLLPKSHPFHFASIKHDAVYYAIEILLGEISIDQLPVPPNAPWDFRFFVETELMLFKAWDTDIYTFVKRADDAFYEQCLAKARYENSTWLKIQAELYYQVVLAWSDLKFGKYEQLPIFKKLLDLTERNLIVSEQQFVYS